MEKNSFNVELLIENPPQIHMTNIFPIYRIVDIRLTITVAPQNDISSREYIAKESCSY